MGTSNGYHLAQLFVSVGVHKSIKKIDQQGIDQGGVVFREPGIDKTDLFLQGFNIDLDP